MIPPYLSSSMGGYDSLNLYVGGKRVSPKNSRLAGGFHYNQNIIGEVQTVRFFNKPLSLQSHVLILVFLVLLIAFILVGLIVSHTVRSELEYRIGMQALNIARAVARQDVLKRYLGQPDGARYIQPVMEDIRKATGALFIVAIDNDGIRYSHPVPERIGQHVVGGDEGPALEGQEYVSVARGTLGISQRGFAPVYGYDGRQVGAVLVGFLTDDVNAQINKVLDQVYLAMATGVIIAMAGSFFVAERVKATMFNMEPVEIAALLEERDAILASLHEGLLAVDKAGRVTLANQEAQRILKCGPDIVGRPVEEVIPNTRLPVVLETGKPELNHEQLINDVVIVTSRVPIKVKDRVVGAVASFRDKTEVKQMAEELTGVKRYAEALRTQTHEFRNRLHTIAGLIQLGDYDQALNYTMEAIDRQQDLLAFLNRKVRPVSLTALLLGKGGRARELGIKFTLLPETHVDELPGGVDADDIGTIVGNLIENAFEAVLTQPPENRRVEVCLETGEEGLEIDVADSGPGVPPELRTRIFESGFSTKSEGRGIGLALVDQLVKNLRGTISVGDSAIGGALFTVKIPWPEEVK